MRSKQAKPDDPAIASASAVRSLSRREHSARQLKAKLQAKGFDDGAAGEAVQKLAESGLQSDARFAEALVRNRIGRGYGPVRIEAELNQAGVDSEVASQAVSDAAPDWQEIAEKCRIKHFGETMPDTRDAWQRQYRYLLGRGFTSDHIRSYRLR